MRVIKELTEKEAKELMPDGLVDALNAESEDTEYCMVCDGTRVKGHECVPLVPLLPDHPPDGRHDFITTDNGDWLCTICGERVLWGKGEGEKVL